MRAADVPAGMLAVRCLRCNDHLAIAPDLPQPERRQVIRDHHLWLCAVPTPNVVVYRRTHRMAPP